MALRNDYVIGLLVGGPTFLARPWVESRHSKEQGVSSRFELFRLSLVERRPGDMFEDPNMSREVYLRAAFGSDWDFEHYGNTFYFRPVASSLDAKDLLIGRLGRQYSMTESLSPDHDLEFVQHEGWKAALLLVDPTHHADGQKVAMNYDKDVGMPFALATSLVRMINEQNAAAKYQIIIEKIFDAESFWHFAEVNKGDVTFLAFDLATPNMFEGREALESDLRDLRDKEHAQEISLQLKSEDGLETDTTRVREAVHYAERGAGSVRARTRTKKTYNSKKKAKAVKLDDGVSDDSSLLVRALAQIGRIFGA